MNFTKYILMFSSLFMLVGCKSQSSATNTVKEASVKNWQTVVVKDGSKPVERHEAAFVHVKNRFYLLGGRGIRPVSIYDTKTGTWSQGTKPPIELHHFQPVVFNDKIYIIGAMTGEWPSETPTKHVYSYDPATDLWLKGGEIPENRRRGSTGNVIHNDKIYISCGIKNGHLGDYKNWLDVYDPKNGSWEILADAPRARDHFQAVLANNSIYLLAGRNSTTPNSFGNTIGAIDVYNIATNTWKTLPNNLPTRRAGNMAVLYQNQIYVIGGESDTQEPAHAEVEVLDLKTNMWTKSASLVVGRHGSGVIIFDDELFIASGCGKRGGEPELFSMEKYGD
ncbi:galactose oxidase [Maribacter sp.]|nr:galactose oxidase [Maribacter sp.]